MTPESKERLWRIFRNNFLSKKFVLADDRLSEGMNRWMFEPEFIQFIQWFELRQAKRRLMKAIFKVLCIKQTVDFLDRILKT